MPQIGTITVSAYREESREVDKLVPALCKAIGGFLPIALDGQGSRDGIAYRYATIGSIRRSITPALIENNLILNHVYGYSDTQEYVVTVLRHSSGQFVSSTSPVPYYPDAQDHKARKTMTCRTHIEGLLGISTEEDGDGPIATDAVNPAWAENLRNARQKLAAASSAEEAASLMERVRSFIESGKLPPDCEEELQAVADSLALETEEVADAVA